jgi:CheY-like chemotaxis protein
MVEDPSMSKEVAQILVAEDNPGTATVIRFALEQAGFQVTVARCGESAWKVLSEHDFDLVVADYQMPNMTGAELCQRMGEDARLADTPVIILTAKAFESDMVCPLKTLAQMGAVPLRAIMPKPFSPKELVLEVRSCLEAGAATA